MGPDVALNFDMQQRYYPFSRLTGPANILVMPGLQSANLSAKLLRELGGESVLGPYLLGLELPVQIAPMTASASDLVTLAVLAAGSAKERVRADRAGSLIPGPQRLISGGGGDSHMQISRRNLVLGGGALVGLASSAGAQKLVADIGPGSRALLSDRSAQATRTPI